MRRASAAATACRWGTPTSLFTLSLTGTASRAPQSCASNCAARARLRTSPSSWWGTKPTWCGAVRCPKKRARPVPPSSTASSLRRRRLCSTTWPSSSRGWCGRSACAKGAKSPTCTPRPARSTRRASPAERGTSSTGWWPGTAAKWPSKSAPSPAMTCLCSDSRSPVPPHTPAGTLLSASSVASGSVESSDRAGVMVRMMSCFHWG